MDRDLPQPTYPKTLWCPGLGTGHLHELCHGPAMVLPVEWDVLCVQGSSSRPLWFWFLPMAQCHLAGIKGVNVQREGPLMQDGFCGLERAGLDDPQSS